MNSSFCQLEVKASLAMYPTSNKNPENDVLELGSFDDTDPGLPDKNKNIPIEIIIAIKTKKAIKMQLVQWKCNNCNKNSRITMKRQQVAN